MSSPENSGFYKKLPYTMRSAVKDAGEFQRLCSDFVSRHVVGNVGPLVDRLRNTEGFEDKFEDLDPRADNEEACDQADIAIVDDGGHFYHFNWRDHATIAVDSDGDSFVDFERFAADKGLNLADWRFDSATDTPVRASDVTDDHEVSELPFLKAMSANVVYIQGTEVIEALAVIAEQSDMGALAADLRNTHRTRSLFEGYILEQYPLAEEEFDSEAEAAANAVQTYSLDVDYIEVYEYWAVSGRFAYLLKEAGQVVAEGFLDTSLDVWGRTTTGQSISMDGVITAIAESELEDELDALASKMFPNVGSEDEILLGVPLNMLGALEEGRVQEATYTYRQSYGRDEHGVAIVANEDTVDRNLIVVSAEDASMGWQVEKFGGFEPGKKIGVNLEGPISLDAHKTRLTSYPRAVEGRFEIGAPSQDTVDSIVSQLERYHRLNAKSEAHKVPENLTARLAALSPAFAASLKAESSAPSMG